MNKRIAHLITRLYPRSWKDRYGEEFEVLLVAEPGSLFSFVNVIRSALHAHLVPTHSCDETRFVPSFGGILKKPSGVIPIGMSLAALVVVFTQIARCSPK